MVLRYLEIAEALKPKFLVIENVPQMLNHGFDGRLGHLSELVIQMLERDLGYKVEVAVVNCADYGVPQLRERAVFIASSIGAASLPPKTHADPKNAKAIAAGLKPWVTVKDAIGDLPSPSMHGDELGGSSLDLYSGDPGAYAKFMRTSDSFPYNHVTRGYRDSVLNIIKEMRPGHTWDTESARMQAKYEKAVACLVKDRDALLTFYDFPAEHWDHLRTSNPIESVFATVRHRTVRTKGALSQDTARLMVFKLVMAAAKTWRKLKGENQLPKVVQGVTFRNGVEVTDTPAQNAA